MKRPTDDLEISAQVETFINSTDARLIEPLQEISGDRMERDEVMPPDRIDEGGVSDETLSGMTEGVIKENSNASNGEKAIDLTSEEGISPELNGEEDSAQEDDTVTVETSEGFTLPPVTLVPNEVESANPTMVHELPVLEESTNPTMVTASPSISVGSNPPSTSPLVVVPSTKTASGGRTPYKKGERVPQRQKSHDDIKNSKDVDIGNVNCQGTGGFIARFSCKTAVSIQEHHIFYAGMTAVLVLYCFLRCFCCSKNRIQQDNRGEYRAVAEQYGNYNDDAFLDKFSDPGSYEEEDDYQDDWSTGQPKRTIEMVTRERNGGLTLEEMNG
mmetsp:Transcript_29313/g.44360  ORF Transcript_29313/g.44360 Transcript_29313/m.44360 type:complete len:329 (-) Transcript_29313:866-1852(-)|eukprot:CAMPEP_0178922296 /NCGR_PEP_ID=MMETSP0786-20121207/16071_1 /TAXON_ID=186022 /ORGANISM="Thalassionema frauenfeldii, Strain CCMP 1798" /LENGTH=328 /DNA_ID=CAMNT_0020596637 /DNA_START=95 /DNA_END=1081 /DNA_ORIENTATION=-